MAATVLKAEGYAQRRLELAGWPARITSYKVGETWRAEVDNVDPGAQIARANGSTKEEAEAEALRKAEERLGRTRVVE
jgi:hypothetical protein